MPDPKQSTFTTFQDTSMQLLSTSDLVSIVAFIVSILSLVASVFSAVSAAKSAEVARSAEDRIRVGERTAALRELMRTAAKVEAEARLAITSYENASRAAIANAACYSTSDDKLPFLISNGEFQQKISEIKLRGNPGITVDTAMTESDEWIAKMQIELDKAFAELSGEKAWAAMRDDQLTYVNRGIAEDVKASERSRGVYVQQDHRGLLV
jgi:hypothetical protein